MSKIILTGASGFIGHNICQNLNIDIKFDFDNIFFHKKDDSILNPYLLLENFDRYLERNDVVIHNGACSSTTESNPYYISEVNFDYSHKLLKLCLSKGVRLIYASSASVYGDGPFSEDSLKKPKNLYALSKAMFDDYAGQFLESETQLVGLRYFNVYGRYEYKKAEMSSVICKFFNQIKNKNSIKLFKNSDKYFRDFIHVKDIVNITKFFIENKDYSGVYNCGTGKARSFQDIADIFVDRYKCDIEYINMPDKLVGKYQNFTESDNKKINCLFNPERISLEKGVDEYLNYLEEDLSYENRIY